MNLVGFISQNMLTLRNVDLFCKRHIWLLAFSHMKIKSFWSYNFLLLPAVSQSQCTHPISTIWTSLVLISAPVLNTLPDLSKYYTHFQLHDQSLCMYQYDHQPSGDIKWVFRHRHILMYFENQIEFLSLSGSGFEPEVWGSEAVPSI